MRLIMGAKSELKKWTRLEVEYREAGMTEKASQNMKAFDWQWFYSERIYLRVL